MSSTVFGLVDRYRADSRRLAHRSRIRGSGEVRQHVRGSLAIINGLLLFWGVALGGSRCGMATAAEQAARGEMPRVIFDTDMGSDCDDAGAMAVLHALADAGELRILGVVFSSGKNRYGVGVCDAINTYYGRGDLPLGQYQGTDVGDPKDSYSKRIATDTDRFGHDVVDQAADMVGVYKSLLRAQPDESVVIVTVGHPHGLVHLMRDTEGAELARTKVKRWVGMGTGGWNFFACGASAYTEELLKRWPTDIHVSPKGKDVKTGHRLLPKTPATNPVREAYRLWGNNALANGRSSWDQLAVLYVARPQLFHVEHSGRLKRTQAEQIVWDPDQNAPKHYLVKPKLSTAKMARLVERLMVRPPRSASNKESH